MSDPAPKRRWFRFSLRTLFWIVSAIGLVFGWLAYHVNWIRDRHAFLHKNAVRELWIEPPSPRRTWCISHKNPLPWSLAILGEHPASCVEAFFEDVNRDGKLTAEQQDELKRARRLFPETGFACWIGRKYKP